MVNNNYKQLAISLYFLVHAGITKYINFIEKVCLECFEEQEKFNNNIRNVIGLEYTILFIFVINKFLFKILDENIALKMNYELENVFMDHALKVEDQDVQNTARSYFASKMVQYNNYKFFTEPNSQNEDLKGTLIWEFSKNISKICGHPNDIRIVTAASSGAEGSRSFRQATFIKQGTVLRIIVSYVKC